MLRSATIASWFVIVGLSLTLVGCNRGQSRVYPPKIDAAAAGAEAIKIYDTNKDGKISGDELDKCPALKEALGRIDPSGQGVITAALITARIRAWQESKLGRTPINVDIRRSGVPLADAEVKLVPEAFLGENMKIASGKTNQYGAASISIPMEGPDDAPGVPPGFYRVEITKSGVKIPARYNTETTLGFEVAMDSPSVRSPASFDVRN